MAKWITSNNYFYHVTNNLAQWQKEQFRMISRKLTNRIVLHFNKKIIICFKYLLIYFQGKSIQYNNAFLSLLLIQSNTIHSSILLQVHIKIISTHYEVKIKMNWYQKKLPLAFIKTALKFSTQRIIKRTSTLYSEANSLFKFGQIKWLQGNVCNYCTNMLQYSAR